MKTGGAQAKGASFEREVCVLFSLWISQGKRRDCFWRTAMSGGRATIARKGGRMNKSQVGDICAVDELGHPFIDRFIVECKHYKDLSIESGIIARTGLAYQFWIKLYRQCKALRFAREPLLILRQNNTKTLIITTWTGCEYLGFHKQHPDFALPAQDTHRIATLYAWPKQPDVYYLEAIEKSQPGWSGWRSGDDGRRTSEKAGRV